MNEDAYYESDDEDMRKKMENDSSSESEASVHEDKKEESDIEVKDVLKKYFKVFLIASGFLALGVVLFYIIFYLPT